MKSLNNIFTLFLCGGLSIYITNAQAVPVIYSLEGSVTNLYPQQYDRPTEILSVGDQISYRFILDDEITSRVDPDGSNVNYTGHTTTSSTDEGLSVVERYDYYAEFAGGNQIFVDENSPDYNPLTGNTNAHFSASEFYQYNNYGNDEFHEVIFSGQGTNGYIQFNIFSPFSEWQAGSSISTLAGFSYMGNSQEEVNFDADLTISIAYQDIPGSEAEYPTQPEPATPIEESPANVPEPTTFLMVLTGLLGIGSLRRRTEV